MSIVLRIEGVEKVDRMLRDCPLMGRRKQIGLCFGAARKLRREWQKERRAAAPRANHRRRPRRLKGRLRGVRVYIPRSATLDTWPEIRIVGPRHLVPTNARGGEYPDWLKLDNIGIELGEKMQEDLTAWIRRTQR